MVPKEERFPNHTAPDGQRTQRADNVPLTLPNGEITYVTQAMADAVHRGEPLMGVDLSTMAREMAEHIRQEEEATRTVPVQVANPNPEGPPIVMNVPPHYAQTLARYPEPQSAERVQEIFSQFNAQAQRVEAARLKGAGKGKGQTQNVPVQRAAAAAAAAETPPQPTPVGAPGLHGRA